MSIIKESAMIIRHANAEDISQIVAIYDRIMDLQDAGILNTGWLRGIYPTKETAEAALHRSELFVGESQGCIVGSMILNHVQLDSYYDANWSFHCNDEEVMVMHTLTVDPQLSGQGYGKRFASFYEEYAAASGCKALRIDTQVKNINARNMYRKLGYKEIGLVPCVFNGIPDVHLVLLQKLLVDNQTKATQHPLSCVVMD